MTEEPQGSVLVDGWLIDAAGHRLVRDGEERRLEPRVVALLLVLAEQPGTVVARDDLKRAVWGDTFISDDAVSAAVIKLRRALDDPARSPRIVQTVAKSGYRVAADAVRGPRRGSADDGSREPAIRVGSVVHVRFDLADEDAGPEAWQQAHDEVTAVLADEIERRGGWAVLGSGSVLGVIGVPRAREDHVARAASCAAAVVAALDGRTVDGVPLQVRCAVVPGELVVMAEGIVSGSPVQEAHDLATRGAPGDVLLADDAADVLGPGSWEPGDDARRLVPAAMNDSAWDVRRRRGLTPLAGRVPDLATIELLADQAEGGFGQVLVLSGDPGVGKSRLLHELRARLESRGWATALGATSSLDPHSPYVAVRRLLHDCDAAGASDADAWSAVLDPEEPDPDWQGLDPVVRQQRIPEMVVEVLVPADRVSLIAVEDVHWADEATRALLSQLADRIARRRCLLVITTRPVGDEPWSDRSHGTRRRVGPLFPDDAAALLDSLVGDDPSLGQWKRDVLDRSAGTPLFLEECARAATGGGGRLRTDQSSVPRSLRALLSERVDALAPDVRSVVARAAVVGRTGSTAHLRHLTDLDDAAFAAAFEAATRSEILRPVRLKEGPGWEFGHALLQEAAYAGIPVASRRGVHRDLADLLLREPGAATSGKVAWHLTEAGEVQVAVAAWLRAARSASEATAYEDAMAHLARARELLPRLPEGRERDEVELQVVLATGTAGVQTEGPTGATTQAAVARAVELADRVGSTDQRFEARWGAWFVVLHNGDLLAADELADSLWELVPELDDQALVLEARHVKWSGLVLLGRTREALHHARGAIEVYRAEEHHRLTYSYGGHDPGVCARNLAALSTWLLGEPEESRRLSHEAGELAERLGHPYSMIEGCHAALTVAAVDGRLGDMPPHLALLSDLIDRRLVPEATQGYVDGFRGVLARGTGDADEAMRLFDAAAPVWREFWGAWCLPLDTAMAETLLDIGDVVRAGAVLDEAEALASASNSPWWDAEILRVRALVERAVDSECDVTSLLTRAAAAADRTEADVLRRRVQLTVEQLDESTSPRRARARSTARPRAAG